MTKTLKIVGIIFLVAAILFGGTYLTINLLNKKTEAYEIFAESAFWDMDMTGGKSIAGSEEIGYKLNDNSYYVQYSLNLQYNYLKPYFSTVGINYFQKKSLKNKIDDVTEKTKILSDYVAQYENNNKNFIPFYTAILPSYIETASAELELIKEMKNILIENEVVLNDTAMLYFDLNNSLIDIVLNVDYRSAYFGYQNNKLHFRGNFTSTSFIQTINFMSTEFLENPNSYTVDMNKLTNDFSYKSYVSALDRYNDAIKQLSQEDMLIHTKKETINEDNANYNKIKTANECYTQLYNSLWYDKFELKICPFSNEKVERTNLLRYVIENGSTEVSE